MGRRTEEAAAEGVGGGMQRERKSSLRSGEMGTERNEAGGGGGLGPGMPASHMDPVLGASSSGPAPRTSIT